MIVCLGVVLFGSNWLGTLCASWTYMSISFTKFRKFSFIIFSNKINFLFFLFSFWHPYFRMLVCLEMSQRLLSLSSLFWIIFLPAVLINCFFPSLCSKLLTWFSTSSPPLLVPCRFFLYFTKCNLYFCLGLFYAVAILSEFFEHPDTQFWTLHLIGCLSPFHLVLSWSFILFFYVGPISLSPPFGSLPVFVSVYWVDLLWLSVLVAWPIVEKRTCKLDGVEP